MRRQRLALASLAVAAATSSLALGIPALASDETSPPPAIEQEEHGYMSVGKITDSVQEEFPMLGSLSESIPEQELIRGGPSFDAQGDSLIVSD